MLSTNAVDGPVTATTVVDSPGVGALTSHSISFYRGKNVTKSGQYWHETVDDFISPGNTVGVKIQMTFSSTLADQDVVYIKMPGFQHFNLDAAIDGSSNAVVLDGSEEVVVAAAFYTSVMTGDSVLYDNGGGGSIPGLTTSTTYYAVKSSATNRVSFAATYAHAIATPPTLVDITGQGTGTSHDLYNLDVKVQTYYAKPNNILEGYESDSRFTATWTPSTETLALTCNTAPNFAFTAGCYSNSTHPITVDVLESNLMLSPKDGFLKGSPQKRFQMHTSSTAVAMKATDLENIDAIGFEHFKITLSGGPHVAASEAARVNFDFKLAKNMVLYPGDNITCFVPKFTLNTSTSFENSNVMNVLLDSDDDFASAYYDLPTHSVHVKVKDTINYGGQATFSLTGLSLPYYGVNTSDTSQTTCGAVASSSVHQSLSSNLFNFSTVVTSFPTVGHFWNSDMDFSPKVAGENTRFTLTFELNAPIAAGEKIYLRLPDFALSSTTSLAVHSATTTPISWTVNGALSPAGYVSITLNAGAAVAAQQTEIVVAVDGLVLPTNGVSKNGKFITISTNAASGPVTKFTPLKTVTGVGYLPLQQISLEPADKTTAITSGGAKNRFRLAKGHNADEFLNEMILVGDQHLLVIQVEGDVLITNGTYTGDAVYATSPALYLYHPGYRPADYYSGSNTEIITFKYIVQEGDTTTDLRMHNVTNIEVQFDEWIRRYSTAPTTSVNLAMPSLFTEYNVQRTSAIKIDTQEPRVVSVNTTKRDGNYATVGERIDVVVHYDYPVSIFRPNADSVMISVPLIELNVDSVDNTARYAYYHSGNGTKALLFVYTIQAGDNVDDLAYKAEGVEYSTGLLAGRTALKTRFGSNEGYIYRAATNLIQEANITLPMIGVGSIQKAFGEQVQIAINTTVNGQDEGLYWQPSDKFPRILSVSSVTADGTYGAGHAIDLLVRFSENVTVPDSSGHLNDAGVVTEHFGGGFPYIIMDVGASKPRYAKYVDDKVDTSLYNHSLVFRYIVQEGDTSADLNYLCTCEDLLSTTYIEMNNSAIIGALPDTHHAIFDLAIDASDNTKVVVGNDEIVISAVFYDFLVTGDAITYSNGGGTDVGGLTHGSTYYGVKTGTTNTIMLAASYNNAVAGPAVPVDLTTLGAGTTHGLTNQRSPYRMRNKADYTLPSPADPEKQNLAKNANIVVDTTAPVILSMTSSHLDGTYGVGESIYIDLNFNRAVTVSGFPRIAVGTQDGCHAHYKSGNTTAVLRFEYKVDSKDSFAMSDLSHAGRTTSLDLNGGWIKLTSQNPTTDAVLTLPVTGKPNSLGYEKDIIIDTAVPSVVGGSVVKRVASSISSVRNSDTKSSYLPMYQTIDVVAEHRNATDGRFKILYNDLETSCIDYNATAETIEAVLIATNLLDVHVYSYDLGGYTTNDGTPDYQGMFGRRHMIEFLTPFTGVSEIAVSFSGCESFVCHNETHFGACGEGGGPPPSIWVNRDIAVYPGVFDVKMSFSHKVQVSGEPFLEFETGNHDAKAKYAPPSVQYVDVGVDASSQLVAGQFQVSYGKFKTGCIDFDAASTVGFQSMKRRLLEIPAIAAIGVKEVKSVPLGNGFRFTVTFYPSALLQQLEAVEYSGRCTQLSPSDALIKIPATEDLTFRYIMSKGSRLVLKAKSDIPKNNAKSVAVPLSYGVKSPIDGLTSKPAHGHKNIGFSSIYSNFNMLQTLKFDTVGRMGSFSRTSISFEPNTLNKNVHIMGSFAYFDILKTGEKVKIKIPGFNTTCLPNSNAGECALGTRYPGPPGGGGLGAEGYLDTATDTLFDLTYTKFDGELVFTAVSDVPANTQVIFTLSKNANFTSPKTAVHANSGTFVISTDSANGVVDGFPIESAEGIGLSMSKVFFTNPRAGQETDVIINFAPTDKIGIGAQVIFTFESFLTPGCMDAMAGSPLDFIDGLTVGYDNDYFKSATWQPLGPPTLVLTTNRILFPREHQVKVKSSVVCGIRIPEVGLYDRHNITIAIGSNATHGSHVYNNITATAIGAEVQKIGSMTRASSSVVFANPVAGEKSAITFTLTPTMAIKKHEKIVFVMIGTGGQSVSETDFALSGADASKFDADFDDLTDTLTFTAKVDTVADTTYVLVVDASNRLRIPKIGYVSGAFNDVTIECNCVNGVIPVTPVQTFLPGKWTLVNAVTVAKLLANAKKITDPTEFYYEFEAPVGLSIGDVIDIRLPGVTCTPKNKTLDVLSGNYKNRFNATWLLVEETMTLEFLERTVSDSITEMSTRNFNITVSKDNGCKVPTTGFHMNTDIFSFRFRPITSSMGFTGWLDFTSTSGVGFLTSQMSFTKGVADGSTPVEINLKFSLSQKLFSGETITFLLPGFTSTESTIILSGDDASKFTATWSSATNKLVLSVTSTIVPIVQMVSIGTANKFILPATGITENSNSFTMSLEAAASADLEMGQIAGYPMRLTEPVGSFLTSQIRFVNLIAGEISGVDIRFTLSGAIAVGETVVLKLGRVTNTEDLTEPLDVQDLETSADSTVWAGIYNALDNTITLECKSAVSSGALNNVQITGSNKLRVPINGTVLNDPDILISTNAAAAPVTTPVAIKDSLALGALVNSELYFDSGGTSAGGNFLGVVKLEFNKILAVGDVLKLRFPTFIDFDNR